MKRNRKTNGASQPLNFPNTKEGWRELLEALTDDPPAGSIKVPVSARAAEVLLEMNTDNRPLKEHIIGHYARQMKENKWHETGQPVIVSKSGRLIDGQHRLWAILESGKTVNIHIIFGVDEDAFSFVDIGKPRSAGDIFAIRGVEYYQNVSSAVRFVMAYYDNVIAGERASTIKKFTPDELYQWLVKHPKMMESLPIHHAFMESKIAGASLMMALHYICARRSKAEADAFFHRVATGLNFTGKTDPAYRLFHELISWKRKKYGRLSRIMTAAFTLKAWNAFRDGKTITKFSWRDESNPDEKFPKAR